MKKRKSEDIRLILKLFFSSFTTAFSIFVLPFFYDGIQANEDKFFLEILCITVLFFLVEFLIIFCLILMLRKELNLPNNKIILVARLALSCLILIAFFSFYCMFAGLLAVIVYETTNSILEFDQIKGILNYSISFLILLILPSVVSVFYEITCSDNKLSTCITRGFLVSKGKYLKLLASIVMLFAVGIIITVLQKFINNSTVSIILKTIIFSVTGTIELSFLENIVKGREINEKV